MRISLHRRTAALAFLFQVACCEAAFSAPTPPAHPASTAASVPADSGPSHPKPAQDMPSKIAARPFSDRVSPEPFAPTFADTVTLRQPPGKRPSVPEKLVFDIVWGGWSFRWVHAGQATLELLPTSAPQIVKMRSLAWCNGFFQTFYPVQDTVISFIHSEGLYPLRFSKILNEGSYRYRGHAIYDQVAHTLKAPDTTLVIAPFTHDVLSAFYFIRSQPLKVGDSLDLAAVSGKKAYNLKVICHRKETVEVPAGRFKALVVEPLLKGDGLFKAKGTLLIWMTDDARHLPVKMQSKIPVGSIKAELTRLP